MTPNLLKDYETSEKVLRGLYDSKLRLAILEALKDGPLRLADLRRVVHANAPNTSAKAKELEKMGMLERIDGDFLLTPYGRAARDKSKELFDFYATYEKFKEFWETHELDGIPDFLLSRLGELKGSELVKSTETDPDFSHDFFVSSLANVKRFMYGIAPVYHEDYATAVFEVAKRGVNIQVVVSEELAEFIEKLPKETKKKFAKGVNLFVIKGTLKVAFTVTENFISLAIKTKDKPIALTYADSDLVSTDPRAIRWGLDLFDYYKKQAKPIKLSDYL